MNYNDAYYFVMRLLKWMDEFFVCVHIYIWIYVYGQLEWIHWLETSLNKDTWGWSPYEASVDMKYEWISE